MTTIVYKDDVLSSDSLTVKRLATNSHRAEIKQKIFLSKDKTLALGYTGDKVPDKKRDFLFDQLKAIISVYENENNNDILKNIELEGNFIEDLSLLIMSKKCLYLFKEHRIYDLSSESSYVIGSGSYFTVPYLESKLSAVEIVERVKKLDTLSGGDVYFIKRSTLKEIELIKD